MSLSRKARIVILGVLTTLMCLAELFFGFWTHSLALTADAFHMTSDVLALVIAWTAIHIAHKRVKSKHLTYGLQRAEVIGAFINGVFLIALCFTIVLSAIERFVMPQTIDNPMLILYVGCAGLLVNICGLFLFHEHGHSHGGHAEDSGAHLNMRGVFLHVLGDALGSVGVIISSSIIQWTTWSWKYLVDPIMSVLIVVIIVTTTIPLLKSASKVLLQGSPSHVAMEEVFNDISKVDNVVSVHDLHVWQLSDDKVVATVHVMARNLSDGVSHQVVGDIRDILHGKGIHSTTIQIECSEAGSCAYQCEQVDCNARNCCTRITEAV